MWADAQIQSGRMPKTHHFLRLENCSRSGIKWMKRLGEFAHHALRK